MALRVLHVSQRVVAAPRARVWVSLAGRGSRSLSLSFDGRGGGHEGVGLGVSEVEDPRMESQLALPDKLQEIMKEGRTALTTASFLSIQAAQGPPRAQPPR